MARPLRIEFPGAIYHVTSRTVCTRRNGRDRLFRDGRDYERFLERLGERVQDAGIRLYAFCLMDDHFHLVLETPEGNLSRFMHTLTTVYTVYYNLRHRRRGRVFDGRFKAKLVSGDEYLLQLSRYVHQNPAWVGGWTKRPITARIERLHTYPWSSYPSYIGRSKPLKFVDYEPILKLTKNRSGPGRRDYQRYVDSGLAKVDTEFKEALKASPCSIGAESFRSRVEQLRSGGMRKRGRQQDTAFPRALEPVAPAAVLRLLGQVFGKRPGAFCERRRNSPLRAVAAKCLIRYSGQTQREAAERLGLGTGAAVSAQVKRLPGLLAADRPLRLLVERAERGLEQLRKRPNRKRT